MRIRWILFLLPHFSQPKQSEKGSADPSAASPLATLFEPCKERKACLDLPKARFGFRIDSARSPRLQPRILS